MKLLFLIFAILTIGGCAASVIPPAKAMQRADRPAAIPSARPALDTRGLGSVIGKDVGTLKRMFGEPRLDVVEVNGRKLQFVGKACVLDTYLYPDGKNGAEIVTYVDTRRGDGAAVDRASCVDALQRR